MPLPPPSTATTMSRSVEPLVVGRVVGDVVDPFSPEVEVIVRYGSAEITNGCNIKPAVAVEKPRVYIRGPQSFGSLYTMVMTDPDAPSPSEPTMREWLHWIVVDIPGGSDSTKGREVVPYMGPQPPTGIHRYVFIVYRQSSPVDPVPSLPHSRGNFDTRRFAVQLGLGQPVGALYYNAQKETTARRKRSS